MSIFCLNCQGLGDPRTVNDLRLVLSRYSPNLVFLSKTKKTVAGMDLVKNKLGNYDEVYVDYRGHSGGLGLLWEKSTQITLLSCSSHHIDVIVDGVGSHNPWRFTGVYG